MKAPVFDLSGKRVRDAELPEALFGVEPNVGVMHQALVRQEANARAGTHKTRTRSDVNRTKSKWFMQKGTGRARHGSRAAPVFVGGGVSHGPQPRSYAQKMPRKMRRLAIASALSAKAASESIALVEGLTLDVPRTKTIRTLLESVAPEGTTLVVLAGHNTEVERSIRNLEQARYCAPDQLNVRDLLRHDKLLIEVDAVGLLEERFQRRPREVADA
jgi:large subunit ribosomal protein L4